MTEQEAFRFGFLVRCADEGLAPVQVQERIKQAKLPNPITFGLGALGLGLGAAGAGGAGLGYLAARAGDEHVDPQEAKKQELLAAYQQYAERARRTAARIRYRLASPPARR